MSEEAAASTTEAAPTQAPSTAEPTAPPPPATETLRDIAPSGDSTPETPIPAPEPQRSNGLLGDDPTDEVPDDGISWRADLPEAHREDAIFAEHKDFDAFVKSMTNLKSMINKKALSKPDADASPEDKAEWNKHIGVPDTAALYKKSDMISEMTTEQEKAYFGDAGFEGLYQGFHDAGLTQDQVGMVVNQFETVMQGQGDRYGSRLEADKAAEEKSTTTNLKIKWAGQFDSNMHQIKNLLSQHPEWKATVDKLGLNSNEGLIDMMFEMTKVFGESSIQGTESPGQAQSFEAQKMQLEKDRESGKINKEEYKKNRSALFKKNREIIGGPQ